MATENAIAALGKVLQYQQHVVDAAQGMLLGDAWLQALPMVEDAVEAQNVHRQLVTFIEASDPRSILLTTPGSLLAMWFSEVVYVH